MHIFNVCYRSLRGGTCAEKAFGSCVETKDKERYERYRNTVFLDRLNCDAGNGMSIDPSMYHFTNSLRLASRTVATTMKAIMSRQEMNKVYLPGRDQTLTIPSSDVLFLRFRPPSDNHANLAAEVLLYPSPIKEILEGQWSAEIASTLQNAKRIALGVTDTWAAGLSPELGSDEVAYFSCTVYKGLEVLYLVDECAGRCSECGREELKTGGLRGRSRLWRELQPRGTNEDRDGDVIQGLGRRYVEVFDLERLGWDSEHPSYLFAKMMADSVRNLQCGPGEGRFQGVRVLMVEDEIE
jgi:hypothetical protein